MEPKRATKVIDFAVRGPWWGNSYCGKLRAALRQLGVPTMHDAFNDGSDSVGFFVSTDKRRLVAARRLIRDYDRYLESGGKDRFDDVIAALQEGEVYELWQDVRSLFWELDALTLPLIGVRLKVLATGVTPHGEEMTFRVSRLVERRRAHRA